VRVRELRERLVLESLVETPSCSVIVMGLDGPSAAASQLVKRLASAGFSVLIYVKRADALSVGGRCALLLAGAVRVVDAESADFAKELTRLVFETVCAVLERAAEEEQLRATMGHVGFVGRSPAMLAVFRSIARLSHVSDLPTLITGETGTGKELVARALHARDRKRRSGPFVALNCSALSPSLVESELFGHRRGAFTNAERDRKGLIRAADGGVLFLDEVAELDGQVQAKLLRVLQENRVRSVGDEDEVPVNVRVLAATNRDLHAMVARQEFRADLFHRLNVLSIHIPPVRERRADIAALVAHFVAKHRAVNPAASQQLHPDVIDALSRLDLPGNARQLENIVRSALVQNDGVGPIGLCDLPPEVWQQLAGVLHDVPGDGLDVLATAGAAEESTPSRDEYTKQLLAANGWSLARSLNSCERSILATALHAAHGNQSDAARRLGITARSVYNMVRRHRLA